MAAAKNESGDRIKGPWSPEEDELLRKLVQRHGARNWSLISKSISGRSGKSCRLRWCNQLSPEVEHRPFTAEEDRIILEAHGEFGNKWATIARMLNGRTDNAIKNHWNSTLKRRFAETRAGKERPSQVLRRSDSGDVSTAMMNGLSLNQKERLYYSDSDVSDSGTNVSFSFPVITKAPPPPEASSPPPAVVEDRDSELTALTLCLPGTRSDSSENVSGEKEPLPTPHSHLRKNRHADLPPPPVAAAEVEEVRKEKPLNLGPDWFSVVQELIRKEVHNYLSEQQEIILGVKRIGFSKPHD